MNSKFSVGMVTLALAMFSVQPAVRAEDPVSVQLTLKDHKFSTSEPHAPAGKPIIITLKNLDPAPAEFESNMLRVEKVVAGLTKSGAMDAVMGTGLKTTFLVTNVSLALIERLERASKSGGYRSRNEVVLAILDEGAPK